MSRTRISTTHDASLIVASIIVASVTVVYRLTSLNGFSNDHYVHLARAQAMLAGDLPIRDYTEEGVPLTVLLSAGAQLVFGHSLFAEMMVMLTSLAVAAGVTCWLTSRVTGSRVLGVTAALMQVLVYPRTYSHPKMLLYSVFLLVAWWYLNAPTRRRLVILSLWTALSFLIRHDHGVYIGLGSAVAIAVAQWRGGLAPLLRRGLEYALVTLLWIAPYLVYVQYHEGIVDYFRTGVATSASEASRTRFVRLTLDSFPQGGWIASQAADPSQLPGIRVRWKPDVDDARRRALESELGLLAPDFDENRTWKYRIEPPGRGTLSGLVSHAEVEDTSGFDRASLTLDDNPGLVARVSMGMTRLGRVRPGPRLAWFFTDHNLSVAFFFAIWSLPLVAMVMSFRTRHVENAMPSPAFMVVVSTLVVVCASGLLRESLDQRIPDIYGSLPVLVACAIAIGWRMRPQDRRTRIAAAAVIVALSSGFVIGTLVIGRLPSKLNQSGLTEGPATVWERAQKVFHSTREWPWSRQWPAGNAWKVARYVHDCTHSDDRLLMTWSAPEMNVFSRRVFAGGETALLPLFRDPSTYEHAVLARLSQQSVPIVLVDPEQLDDFRQAYPAIGTYIAERFHKVGAFTPDPRQIHVYAEMSRVPAGTDADTGWPCFVSR